MQHDSIFRCIQATCGRTLPRSVKFCPYCGTAQHEGAGRTEGHAVPPAPMAAPMQPAPPPPVQPTPPVPPAQPAQPTQPRPDAAGAHPATPAAAAAAASAAAAVEARQALSNASAALNGGAGSPVPPSAPPPGGSAAARPVPPAAPAPPPGARPQSGPRPGGPQAAPPPRREPLRLRWWLLALAALWAIWLWAKPSTRRIEAQMDKAIALAQECKPREAQTELIALRQTKATPEQLQRVQTALNDASGMCTRKRQRDKAWRDTQKAVESALASSSADRARQRLRTFTRRWGEDDETRALKEDIDARYPEHPRADEVEGGGGR